MIATLAFSAYCGVFLYDNIHGFPVFVVDVHSNPIVSTWMLFQRNEHPFRPTNSIISKNNICSRKKKKFSVQFGCASILIAAIIVWKCYYEHSTFWSKIWQRNGDWELIHLFFSLFLLFIANIRHQQQNYVISVFKSKFVPLQKRSQSAQCGRVTFVSVVSFSSEFHHGK